MKELQLREAKTTLSAVVEAAEKGEPTTIHQTWQAGCRGHFSRGMDEAQNEGSILCRSFVGRPPARSGRPAEEAPGPDRTQARRQVAASSKCRVTCSTRNALSILAPPTVPRNAATSISAAFRAWVREHGEELFLSAITLAEIQDSISQLERNGATRRAGVGSVQFSNFISPGRCR
jgi:hypothetical protein